jgi:hypothetical protein
MFLLLYLMSKVCHKREGMTTADRTADALTISFTPPVELQYGNTLDPASDLAFQFVTDPVIAQIPTGLITLDDPLLTLGPPDQITLTIDDPVIPSGTTQVVSHVYVYITGSGVRVGPASDTESGITNESLGYDEALLIGEIESEVNLYVDDPADDGPADDGPADDGPAASGSKTVRIGRPHTDGDDADYRLRVEDSSGNELVDTFLNPGDSVEVTIDRGATMTVGQPVKFLSVGSRLIHSNAGSGFAVTDMVIDLDEIPAQPLYEEMHILFAFGVDERLLTGLTGVVEGKLFYLKTWVYKGTTYYARLDGSIVTSEQQAETATFEQWRAVIVDNAKNDEDYMPDQSNLKYTWSTYERDGEYGWFYNIDKEHKKGDRNPGSGISWKEENSIMGFYTTHFGSEPNPTEYHLKLV